MAILSTRKDQQPPGGLPSWTGGPALTETFLRTGALQIDYFLEARNGAAKTLVPFPSQPQNVQVNRLYYEKPLYTFGENLEILAYLFWPGLIVLGKALIADNDTIPTEELVSTR